MRKRGEFSMKNRGRVIKIREKKDSELLSRKALSESKLNSIAVISSYEEYCKVLFTLRYLESKHEMDLTETDEEMIEKSKILIRRLKYSIESERLNISDGNLEVNLNDGALKLINNIKSIDNTKLYNICKETLGLLQTLENETASCLELVTIGHLEELIEKYDAGGWVEAKEVE